MEEQADFIINEQKADRDIYQAKNIIINLTNGVDSLSADYAVRIQNFFSEYLGTVDRPVPFGGRDSDLEMLDAWLDDPQKPPYLLLAAPAGRGKSALLVHWGQKLLATREDLAIVFIPNHKIKSSHIGILIAVIKTDADCPQRILNKRFESVSKHGIS